ncbi:MAG: hypothetical protein IPK13_03505 [Deltaproteobacteria bacterium]|nr:hypothetical protein [Deltaproteobacteria bacterium]
MNSATSRLWLSAFVFTAFGAASMGGTRPANAQDVFEPAARQGYYLALGLRNGWGVVHDSDLGLLDLMPNLGLTLRTGQVVNDHLGLGIFIESGGGAGRKWLGSYGTLAMEGQYIPIANENLALRGGIGLAFLGVARRDEAKKRDDDPTGDLGTLYKLGMSYDWFPAYDPGDGSGGFAVTVFAEGQFLSAGDLWSSTVFVGVEASYWFGFDRSRLTLSEDQAFEP